MPSVSSQQSFQHTKTSISSQSHDINHVSPSNRPTQKRSIFNNNLPHDQTTSLTKPSTHLPPKQGTPFSHHIHSTHPQTPQPSSQCTNSLAASHQPNFPTFTHLHSPSQSTPSHAHPLPTHYTTLPSPTPQAKPTPLVYPRLPPEYLRATLCNGVAWTTNALLDARETLMSTRGACKRRVGREADGVCALRWFGGG